MLGTGPEAYGFSTTARIMWKKRDESFPACTFFFLSGKQQFHTFRPGSAQSGSTNCDDCGRAFPDELVSLLSSNTKPTQYNQPTPTLALLIQSLHISDGKLVPKIPCSVAFIVCISFVILFSASFFLLKSSCCFLFVFFSFYLIKQV